MTRDELDNLIDAIGPFRGLSDLHDRLTKLGDLDEAAAELGRSVAKLKGEVRKLEEAKAALAAEVKAAQGKGQEQLALAQRSVEELWSQTRTDVDNYIRDRRAMADAKLAEAERAMEAAKAVVAEAAAKLGGR
jgi:hypothetical protein